jgi:Na+/H+-dicarboxylate symporter
MGVAYLRESEDDRIRKAVNTVFDFFDGGAEVMYKVVNWILQYAPIGVFTLIAVVFGNQGPEAFGPLGMVTVSVYAALLVHLLKLREVSSYRCHIFYPPASMKIR